jgi:hypothetical protein
MVSCLNASENTVSIVERQLKRPHRDAVQACGEAHLYIAYSSIKAPPRAVFAAQTSFIISIQ